MQFSRLKRTMPVSQQQAQPTKERNLGPQYDEHGRRTDKENIVSLNKKAAILMPAEKAKLIGTREVSLNRKPPIIVIPYRILQTSDKRGRSSIT